MVGFPAVAWSGQRGPTTTALPCTWFCAVQLAVQQIPQLLLNAMLTVPGGNVIFLVLTSVLFILLGAVLEGLPAVVCVKSAAII